MYRTKLLLVEDEEVLAMVIKETLEGQGFDIAVANNGVDGWSKFIYDTPDICLIDIMLPRKDGLSLLSDIRKRDELIPVVLLTAKTQMEDVLKGLKAGADDYIKKPFGMEELILRLKRLVRRANLSHHTEVNNETNIGDYDFFYTRLELVYHQVIINLSQREADLLKLLLVSKNALLDKSTALIKIWGDDNIFNSRSMDVYITRLRKYFVHDPKVQIVNVRGYGYKLVD